MAKKLLFEIFCLMIFVGIAIGLIEWRYISYITPVDQLMQHFEKKTPTADYLFLGNSHILPIVSMLDSSAEKLRYASFAYGGMDLFWSAVLLEKRIHELPKLQIVILGLDEEMMGYNQTYFKQEYANRAFYRYTDTIYDPSTSEIILAKSNFFRANRNPAFIFTGKSDVELKDMLKAAAPTITAANCKQRAQEISVFRFYDGLIEENTKLLSIIIEECAKANKKLLIVTLPKTACYLSYRNKEAVALGHHIIDSLVKQHSARWVDFSIQQQPDSFFRDADHLNYAGSAFMWEKIKNELIIDY